MTDPTSGHPDAGLSLVPLANITLKSFVYNSQGLPDTVYVQRVSDGKVMFSEAIPVGVVAYPVMADLELLRGETYRLLAADPDNGQYANFSGFPAGNPNLSVEGTWALGGLQSDWWFHFTSLRSDCAVCTPSHIPGPTPTSDLAGGGESGLSITATLNTRLRSFRFYNQGLSDTVRLVRESDGAVLHQISTSGGEDEFLAMVDWHLVAGETYHLVSVKENNGRFVDYTGWPVRENNLTVNGSWGSGLLQTNRWVSFTDLRTRCWSCPLDTIGGLDDYSNTLNGWPNSGLSITPVVETILRGFTFNGQGGADEVRLVRDADSAVIGTLAIPAGVAEYRAVVDWPLAAGENYRLISLEAGNGRYGEFSSWPVSNSILRINASWGNDTLQSAYWFTFSDLIVTSDCSIFEFDFEGGDLVGWAQVFGAARQR
jgi:hypothetical protein